MKRLALIAILALAALAAPAQAATTGLDRLLAPASICPSQGNPELAEGVQLRAMLCLTNYARARSGRQAFLATKPLVQAAGHKAADILACEDFSHEACGREFTYWMGHFGYLASGCWTAAENIAWGTGQVGSVRAIFRAWLHSPGHRENILGPYGQIGIGLRSGDLEGNEDAHVWVQEFGSHSC